jgi:hypothetical protein
MQRAFFPIEVSVLGILHLSITNTGIQKESVGQLFFLVHLRKHILELLLRVGFRRLLGVVEFGEDLAGNEDVPCHRNVFRVSKML